MVLKYAPVTMRISACGAVALSATGCPSPMKPNDIRCPSASGTLAENVTAETPGCCSMAVNKRWPRAYRSASFV